MPTPSCPGGQKFEGRGAKIVSALKGGRGLVEQVQKEWGRLGMVKKTSTTIVLSILAKSCDLIFVFPIFVIECESSKNMVSKKICLIQIENFVRES